MFNREFRIAVGFFVAVCAFVSVGPAGAYAGVTGTTLSVDHATYSGPCPVTLSFTGSISGSPGTTFRYSFNRYINGVQHVQDVGAATLPASGTLAVSDSFSITSTSTGINFDQIWVHNIAAGQSDVYSTPRTSYAVSCAAPLVVATGLVSVHVGIPGATPAPSPGGTVRSVSITADTPLYAGPCPVWVNFTARASGTPNASFHYGWNANFGISSSGLAGSLDSTGTGSFNNRIGFSTSSAGWYQFWVLGDGAAQPDVFSTRMYYGVTCTSTAPIPVAATPAHPAISCLEGCGPPAPVTVDPTSQSFAYITSETSDADLFLCTSPHRMEPLVTTFPTGLVPVGFANQQRGGAHGDVCGHHRDIVYRAFATFDLRWHITVRPVYKVLLIGITSGVDTNGGPCSVDVYKTYVLPRGAHGHLGARSDFPRGTLIAHAASALAPVVDITSTVLLPPPAVPGTLDPNVTFMLVGGDETFGFDQRRCVIPLRMQVIIQNSE